MALPDGGKEGAVRKCVRAYGETIVESRTKILLVCPKLGCVFIR